MNGKALSNDVNPVALKAMLGRIVWKKSDALIECFMQIIKETYEPSVESMTISASCPVDWYSSGPYYQRYLDGKDKLITTKRSGNFAGDAKPMGISFDNLPVFDNFEAFEKNGYSEVLGKIVSDFTYDCWLKAGGWFFPIPTTLHLYREPGMGGDVDLTKTNTRIFSTAEQSDFLHTNSAPSQKNWWQRILKS